MRDSVAKIIDDLIKGTSVVSILITKNENMIVKELDNNGRYNLRSLSKMLVEIACGFAESDGLFALEDSISKFFPNYSFNNNYYSWNDASIKNLLEMSLGMNKQLLNGFPCKNIKEKDFLKYIFSYPLSNKPGEVFLYNNACYYILSAIIQKLCHQKLDDYLNRKLLYKIGVKNYIWNTCQNGIVFGASNLFMCHQDYLSIASLILNHGFFNGKKIIPEASLNRIFNSGVLPYETHSNLNLLKKVRYGSGTWKTNSDIFYADGKDGQCCVFCPKEKLIVSTISRCTDTDIILGLVEKAIKTFPSYSNCEMLLHK